MILYPSLLTRLSTMVRPQPHQLLQMKSKLMPSLGIILETDPVVVATRVSRPPAQDAAAMRNIDLSEQGLLNAWEFGKQKLGERLRQGL